MLVDVAVDEADGELDPFVVAARPAPMAAAAKTPPATAPVEMPPPVAVVVAVVVEVVDPPAGGGAVCALAKPDTRTNVAAAAKPMIPLRIFCPLDMSRERLYQDQRHGYHRHPHCAIQGWFF